MQAVRRAHILAAGVDLETENEEATSNDPARLRSVFDLISFGRKATKETIVEAKYYPLSSLEAASFPLPLSEALATDYRQLFDEFTKALQWLPLDMGVRHYISSLISLLENFTWCIPHSSHKKHADISLFDHARTSAAIAQALYFYHVEQGGRPGDGADTLKKFILLGGDLSGIQNYIFQLDKSHSTGVAKLFRARSCYLQAITRSVILDLLERLDLNPVAQLMDAGGRFVLLVPASQKVLNILPGFERELQQWFFEKFSGVLCLNLVYTTEMTEGDLQQERFREVFDFFSHQLEASKLNKFNKIMKEGVSPVIDLDFSRYMDGACRICRAMPAVRIDPDEEGQVASLTMICQHCRDQIEIIGKRLPTTRYMLIDRQRGNKAIELFNGLYLHLRKEIDEKRDFTATEIINIKNRVSYSHQAIAAHLPMITQADVDQWQSQGKLVLSDSDVMTYLGEEVSIDMPKTFNILAGESREMQTKEDGSTALVGKAFLGALKADVDNLGLIFSIGLGSALSITRFACLSRMLNHFFSDYLVRRIEADFPEIYIVFAGGDDFFLLGPWTKIILFAQEVGRQFRRYVGNNPEVTLSAGIAVGKAKLPVPGLAALADSYLEESKSRNEDGVTLKNAVTAFNTTVSWADFEKLIEKGDWLHSLLAKNLVPMGLAGRLLNYGQEHRDFIRGNIKKGIYISHMQYDFARNITDKTVFDATERASILEIQHDKFMLRNMRLPVSWALYRLRKD